jgi:hypothetical protein
LICLIKIFYYYALLRSTSLLHYTIAFSAQTRKAIMYTYTEVTRDEYDRRSVPVLTREAKAALLKECGANATILFEGFYLRYGAGGGLASERDLSNAAAVHATGLSLPQVTRARQKLINAGWMLVKRRGGDYFFFLGKEAVAKAAERSPQGGATASREPEADEANA